VVHRRRGRAVHDRPRVRPHHRRQPVPASHVPHPVRGVRAVVAVERRPAPLGHGVGCHGQRAGLGGPRRETAARVPDRARHVQRRLDDIRLHGARRRRLLQHLAHREARGWWHHDPARHAHLEPATARHRACRARALAALRRTGNRADLGPSGGSPRLEHDDLQPQARQRLREARQDRRRRAAGRARQTRDESSGAAGGVRGRDTPRERRRPRAARRDRPRRNRPRRSPPMGRCPHFWGTPVRVTLLAVRAPRARTSDAFDRGTFLGS
jgi:hypothetical protein